MTEKNTSIFHYGKLGMRWGQRRASGPPSDEHKALKEIKGKQAHELTNLQIRKAAERIQLEKQYKDLTKKQPPAAVKAVNEILASQGKTMVATFVASTAALAVKYVLDNRSTIIDKASSLIKIIPKGG